MLETTFGPLKPSTTSTLHKERILLLLQLDHLLPLLSTTKTSYPSITMFRSQIVRQARLLSTSARLQKSPVVEAGKDALKKIDRTVADAAAKGIETGGTLLTANSATFIRDGGV